MSASSKGAGRERKVRDILVSEGWVVYRGAASHGCADLVAMRNGDVRLIQVKANRAGGPYSNFRPGERRALLDEAERAGAFPELAYWPIGGELRWIPGEVWPV